MTPDPALSSYQTQAALTATPGGLVLMLFDGARAAIAKAELELRGEVGQDLELAHKELTRAQDILSELQVSLDFDTGGRIATSLSSVYLFCIEQLVTANVDKDPAPLPAVDRMLERLRSAFATAVEEAA